LTGQPKGQRDVSPGAPFEPVYVYKMLQTIAVNPHFKVGYTFMDILQSSRSEK